MSYKRLIPCIFLKRGNAVKWFDNDEVISDAPVELARHYCGTGADELLIFDLSRTDEEHDEAIDLMKKIHRVICIPMIAGGNIRRLEDVKKILYTGAKRALLNFSKPSSYELITEASARFGKERLAVSLPDFDALFKRQHLIEENASQIIFMHRLDLNSVANVTGIPCVVVTDTMQQEDILGILQNDGVKGVSGLFISSLGLDHGKFKALCTERGIQMTSFESVMDFTSFRVNEKGLLPVVVQDYRTSEVLMVAYMNEEAFQNTMRTGRMTYFSRSRNALWVKGETSGHFQYVRSMSVDCDNDTLLAKVDQVGAACHTGNRSCFYRTIAGSDQAGKNPYRIFESLYQTVADRKENPKEGSYTNYLFEKGMDKILKKVGEESAELIIAAKNTNPEEVKYELADLIYHATVLMVEKKVTWEDIAAELADR